MLLTCSIIGDGRVRVKVKLELRLGLVGLGLVRWCLTIFFTLSYYYCFEINKYLVEGYFEIKLITLFLPYFHSWVLAFLNDSCMKIITAVVAKWNFFFYCYHSFTCISWNSTVRRGFSFLVYLYQCGFIDFYFVLWGIIWDFHLFHGLYYLRCSEREPPLNWLICSFDMSLLFNAPPYLLGTHDSWLKVL